MTGVPKGMEALNINNVHGINNDTYRVYSNRTQAKKIITTLTFARFSGKGRQLLH